MIIIQTVFYANTSQRPISKEIERKQQLFSELLLIVLA